MRAASCSLRFAIYFICKVFSHSQPVRFDVALSQYCVPIKTRRVSEGEAKRPLNEADLAGARVLRNGEFSALPLANASGFDNWATSKPVRSPHPLSAHAAKLLLVNPLEFQASRAMLISRCQGNQ